MEHGKHTGRIAGAVALAALLIGVSEAHDPDVHTAEPSGPNTGKISFDLGMDVETKYYFRGILQEDEEFIGQPYAEVGITVYEGDGALNSIKLTGGIWNSIHSEHTGASSSAGPRSWYEADLYGGVTFGVLDEVEFSTIYTAYTSPNDAFSTVQEVAFGMAYDDSELLGDFAMSPYFTFAVETDGTAFGPDRGTYLEVGGGPEFPLIEDADYPVTLAIPLTLGLSVDNYYETSTDEDTFGYFKVGLEAGVPLAFLASEYGAWQFTAGAYYLTLGDSLRDANEGDDWEFLGKFGIAMTY
jgi:hypothetical protein